MSLRNRFDALDGRVILSRIEQWRPELAAPGVVLLALLLASCTEHRPEPIGAEKPDARYEFERLRDPATGEIPAGIREAELRFAATLPKRPELTAATPDGTAAARAAGVYAWEHRGPSNVGGRTRALALDVTGEDTILAGGASGGMWRSSDGGASWVNTTDAQRTIPVTTIAQDTRPGREATWYIGTGEDFSSGSGFNAFARFLGDGLRKSTDNGRTWQPLPSTISGTPHILNADDIVWRVAVDASNLDEDEVYMATTGGISRSVDGGGSWERVIASTSSYTDVVVAPDGVVYAALSRDGGKRGIFRSDDGVTFTDITPVGLRFRNERTVLALAPSNPNRLYLIAETPQSGARGSDLLGRAVWHSIWSYLYVSGDGTGEGGIWDDRSENVPLFGNSFGDFNSQGGYDLDIAVKPDDENVVFVGGTNLYRSTDGFTSSDNTTWLGGYIDEVFDLEENRLLLGYDYPDHHPDIHTILFSRDDPTILFTGSDGGVHKTLDCLRTDSIDWIPLNNGYLTTQFYSVAIDHETKGSRAVVGGMQDNGTWRSTGGDRNDPWIFTGSGDGAYVGYGDGGRLLYVAKQRGRLYRVELDTEGNQTGWARIDPEVEDFDFYRFINPFVVDPSERTRIFTLYQRQVLFNRDVTRAPLENTRPVEGEWDSIVVEESPFVLTSLGISHRYPSSRLYVGNPNGSIWRIDNPLGTEPEIVDVRSDLFVDRTYTACIAVDPLDGSHAIAVFSNYGVVSLFETTDAGATWQSVSGNLEEEPDGTGAGPSCRWAVILRTGDVMRVLVGTSVGLFSTDELDGDETVWIQEGPETIGNRIVDMVDGRTSDGYVAAATHGGGVYTATIGELSVEREESSWMRLWLR